MIGTLRGHQRCGWAGARRLAHRPSHPTWLAFSTPGWCFATTAPPSSITPVLSLGSGGLSGAQRWPGAGPVVAAAFRPAAREQHGSPLGDIPL